MYIYNGVFFKPTKNLILPTVNYIFMNPFQCMYSTISRFWMRHGHCLCRWRVQIVTGIWPLRN